jgi:rubrerythrin
VIICRAVENGLPAQALGEFIVREVQMENFSAVEVIEQAIQTERLGRDFYNEMSSRFSDNEQMKELFSRLAAFELAHEKKFKEIKSHINDESLENWEEASMYLRAIVESEFFLGNKKSLPELTGIKSAKEAIRYAIGFEKETLLYYVGLRDSVKDYSVLDQIVDEEKSHIRWLSDLSKKI